MKPYGRRAPIRRTVPGHQDCATCLPDDVSKARARREPWRSAYEAFCAEMDWGAERQVRLFG